MRSAWKLLLLHIATIMCIFVVAHCSVFGCGSSLICGSSFCVEGPVEVLQSNLKSGGFISVVVNKDKSIFRALINHCSCHLECAIFAWVFIGVMSMLMSRLLACGEIVSIRAHALVPVFACAFHGFGGLG